VGHLPHRESSKGKEREQFTWFPIRLYPKCLLSIRFRRSQSKATPKKEHSVEKMLEVGNVHGIYLIENIPGRAPMLCFVGLIYL
jgi:hypothetical protein